MPFQKKNGKSTLICGETKKTSSLMIWLFVAQVCSNRISLFCLSRHFLLENFEAKRHERRALCREFVLSFSLLVCNTEDNIAKFIKSPGLGIILCSKFEVPKQTIESLMPHNVSLTMSWYIHCLKFRFLCSLNIHSISQTSY